MPLTPTDQSPGAHHLAVALQLAGLAWLAMTIQEFLLFARPTPYGGPYVEHWYNYIHYALFYNLLGVMLVSAPIVLLWLIWLRRPVRGGVAKGVHYTQLVLLMLTVALDHADNEVMRHMGVHLSRNLLSTYFKVNAWGSDMLHIFLTDRGGPGVPFLVLFAVPFGLWWAGRRVIRRSRPLLRLGRWPVALAVSLVPLLIPLYVYNFIPGGYARRWRTRPAILTLYTELGEELTAGRPPAQFQSLARRYQERWFERSGDSTWRFPDPERPLVRVPLTPPSPSEGKPWNVIYLQLETFRGWNTGFLRPDLPESPTPFLDQLAQDSASAFWRRHLSMGPPTTSGLIAGTCSIKPHTDQVITTHFTYTALECLPLVLRRHGYALEIFTDTDPDWDGETVWLQRWYDASHYSNVSDRELFHRAAGRIRELGQGSRPFMATVVSGSNHYPFRRRDAQFNLDPVDRPDRAIRNTMRYTDDVVREFLDALRKEPWFARTLVVITGDHGYNLGEHSPAGQNNGWRESVWVPLLIHGAHPRLPRGGHDEMATMLDIAPTVTDLLSIRDPNPWMGSSLLHRGREHGSFAMRRETLIFGEQGRFSMVVDPSTDQGRLYDAIADPLQQKDISAAHPEIVAALRRQADDEGRLLNFLLEVNRVWLEPAREGCPENQGPDARPVCVPKEGTWK
jgi:phosphoglycerol transferase MdoB-like AlkP superfamily enzyme